MMLRKQLRWSLAYNLVLVLIVSAGLTAFAEEPSMPPMPPMTEERPMAPMAETPVMAQMPMASMMMVPPKSEEPWYKNIEISGLVDAYYSYNFNHPASLTNQGVTRARNFDVEEDQFQLSLAELVIQKAPSPVGFRVDLAFGPTADLIAQHENTGCLLLGASCVVDANQIKGKETFKNIKQAYISWTAPVGRGLTIDVGKFETWMMAEMTESNLNWNYSRSFIYSLAIPYFHAGIRAGYPITDTLAVHAYFVNGWDNDTDTNRQKTFGTEIAWNPLPGLMIVQNWIGGVEGFYEPLTGQTVGTNWRNVWDTNVTYIATNKLAFMLDAVQGFEPNTTIPNPNGSFSPFRWSGVAGYARFAPTDRLAFSPRLEWFRDNGGLRTGAVHHVPGITKTLYELTWTNEFKISKNLITRLEFRRDMSDKNVFENQTGCTSGIPIGSLCTKNHQDTVLVGVMYTF